MRSKDERKRDCKTGRVVKKVTKEFSVEWMKEPTEVLLVCNAGLMTESSCEQLLELFSPFGPVTDVRMIPKKSFSFIAYANVESCVSAMEAVHGKLGLHSKQPEKVLYLAYLDKMPDEESTEVLRRRWQSPWPEGLALVDDFLSQEEALGWMESVAGLIETSEEEDSMKLRKVCHFGYNFNYDINNIDLEDLSAQPFPRIWSSALERAVADGYLEEMPDQCTVNRYLPGQGIPAHVDTHSCCTRQIASISLGSDITMDFLHLGAAADCADSVSLRLKNRSLMVMSDEARYAHSHGIVPRKHDVVLAPPHSTFPSSSGVDDGGGNTLNCNQQRLTLVPRTVRVSFTFRKTMGGRPCLACGYPKFCDSQKNQRMTMDDAKARDLEIAHVHKVYEEIAGHFSDTRHSPWPKVLDFLDAIPRGGLLIDVGCGNGKYMGRNSTIAKIGCDYSMGLLSICRERGYQAVRCDALKLPYRDGIADGCMSIAVIHHLSTNQRRRAMIEEIKRVLRPGGRALVYAWAKDQEHDQGPSTYLKQGGLGDNKNKTNVAAQEKSVDTDFPLVLPVHKNRTKFEHADLLVPWKTTSKQQKENTEQEHQATEKTFHRFYHVFDELELENLIEMVDGLRILQSYYDQGNWCVIFEKATNYS